MKISLTLQRCNSSGDMTISKRKTPVLPKKTQNLKYLPNSCESDRGQENFCYF